MNSQITPTKLKALGGMICNINQKKKAVHDHDYENDASKTSTSLQPEAREKERPTDSRR